MNTTECPNDLCRYHHDCSNECYECGALTAIGQWISVKDELPELKDDGVLVYFSETGSIETVHIEDYFRDITSGRDENGDQTYTKWYKSQGVTHWMRLPASPEDDQHE